ncbi:MAG: HAMP domain-containing histidine kinase [Clostridiales bacterium]|nr:HAMP domain-containing histidine kinase [Clostridiales bacterium]
MKASGKTGKRADYDKIKRKLYSRVLVAIVAAVAFVALLRQFVQRQGVLGDWIVNFLERIFRLDRREAMSIYQYAIRNNMEILTSAAVAVCFFFLCRIALSGFMRYFDEANAGIDALVEGGGAPVELSPEMAFMEQKLNTLRQALEKREQDAKLAERRKNDLVMYLAHDIKTPLTSVIGYLSLLDEAPDMPAEQRAKYAHIALDKAYRLEQLIDEFFEITRYNLQTIALAKERIDLCYMLAQLADEFYPQLSASGKRAAIRASEGLTAYGDPGKLARVFNNVLKNAAAYSPDNSVIDISAAVSGDTLSVVFTNAGSIPKDKLASIFDKFYRLDSARSSNTGGAGLGLAVAKEIVAAHGGRIYADSGDGRTSFTVELPAAPDKGQ